MKFIVSETYRKKLTDVCESSEKTMPAVKYMAIGNGAEDSSGKVIELNGSEKALRNELLRKELEIVERDGSVRINYGYLVKIDELVNSRINETALYDKDGDLVAIKVFESRVKRPGMEMTFVMTVKN